MSRFLLIPQEILTNKNLLGNEKIVLTQIYNFCKDGKECFASNEYLSVMLGINEETLVKILDNLERFGLVSNFAGKKNIHFNLDSIKYFSKKPNTVATGLDKESLSWPKLPTSLDSSAEKQVEIFSHLTKQAPT